MGTISENVAKVRVNMARAAAEVGRSPADILLVGASKTKGADAVREAIAAGVDALGENRAQEMDEKRQQGAYEGAPLHFIGHLQKNKLKLVVGKVDLIHSADSISLLQAIERYASELGVEQDVLLEVNIGQEASKSGMSEQELPYILEEADKFSFTKVKGLMCIPPVSEKKGENRPYFARMFKLFVDISEKKYDNIRMDFLSMGMSGDYEDAIREGANMIRVGSAIFGAREYSRTLMG